MVDLLKFIDDFENSAIRFCEHKKVLSEKLKEVEDVKNKLSENLRGAEEQIAELKKELIMVAQQGMLKKEEEKLAIKTQIQELVRDIEETIEELNV